MSMIDINHAYSQFYGLYSDVDYDEAPTVIPDKAPVDDDASFPAPTYTDKPLCSVCKEPNLSLRDERCISCRAGISLR